MNYTLTEDSNSCWSCLGGIFAGKRRTLFVGTFTVLRILVSKESKQCPGESFRCLSSWGILFAKTDSEELIKGSTRARFSHSFSLLGLFVGGRTPVGHEPCEKSWREEILSARSCYVLSFTDVDSNWVRIGILSGLRLYLFGYLPRYVQVNWRISDVLNGRSRLAGLSIWF